MWIFDLIESGLIGVIIITFLYFFSAAFSFGATIALPFVIILIFAIELRNNHIKIMEFVKSKKFSIPVNIDGTVREGKGKLV